MGDTVNDSLDAIDQKMKLLEKVIKDKISYNNIRVYDDHAGEGPGGYEESGEEEDHNPYTVSKESHHAIKLSPKYTVDGYANIGEDRFIGKGRGEDKGDTREKKNIGGKTKDIKNREKPKKIKKTKENGGKKEGIGRKEEKVQREFEIRDNTPFEGLGTKTSQDLIGSRSGKNDEREEGDEMKQKEHHYRDIDEVIREQYLKLSEEIKLL